MPRVYPIEILQLEAALRRLNVPIEKREEMMNEIKRRELGYQGEKRVDYFLSYLEEARYTILNNVRLLNGNNAFELDTILVCAQFVLVIGIKNFRGELFFDLLLKQTRRKYNNTVENVEDFIAKSKRHQILLKNFFRLHNLPTLPIYSLVLISHHTTPFKTNPGLETDLMKQVMHADHFLEYLENLRKANPNRRLTDRQLETISLYLYDHHTPLDFRILERHHLTQNDVTQGVQCPHCYHFQMNWKYAKWHCPNCGSTSFDAHEQAIYDYLLLNNKRITNAECRQFLNIKSRKLIRSFLSGMPLVTNGNTRTFFYTPPDDWTDLLLLKKNLKLKEKNI